MQIIEIIVIFWSFATYIKQKIFGMVYSESPTESYEESEENED